MLTVNKRHSQRKDLLCWLTFCLQCKNTKTASYVGSKKFTVSTRELRHPQQTMRREMLKKMTPCHQAPSASDWRGKNEKRSLVSHQSFVMKKEIGMSLPRWCCGDTESVQWDGFHFLHSHGGSVPTEGNLKSWQVAWYCVASASSHFQRLSFSHVIK